MDSSVRLLILELSRLDAALALGDSQSLTVTLHNGGSLPQVLDACRDNKIALMAAAQDLIRTLPASETLHALPTDRSRLPQPCPAKAMVVARIRAELPVALAVFASAHGRSWEQAVAALTAAFLARYSGESSIALGCWEPARQSSQGNLSLLHGTLTAGTRVSELLSAATFPVTVADLDALSCLWSGHCDQGYHPFFQIMLTFEDGDELVGPRQYRRRDLLDLNIHVCRREGACDIGWEYSTSLFSQNTVARMAENFARFLDSALQDPESDFMVLDLISAMERRQLSLLEPTRQSFDDTATIHSLFERQARLTPDAPAICHGPHEVTYRQLDAAATRLALHLRAMGVHGEQFVGVYLGRSPALVCSLLAVLKAGAAYLPLDPTYPAERIAYLLDDARVATVITDSSLSSRFADADYALFEWLPGELDTLDSARLRTISDAAAAAFDSTVDHRRLAYAIYTSGSTGQPKGVMIEHRNTVCFLRWVHDTFSQDVMQNVLASTSMNFDLSIFEFFGPLSGGGRLTIVDSLLDLIASPDQYDAVTLINSVPSAVNELVLSGRIPDSVRVVNLAGEPLRRALADSIYAGSKVESVYNLYGPSEDTTYSTFTLVEKGDEHEPSIGMSLPHSQAYILDAHLARVPVGVVGELYLGGASLSRGYLNKPDLTQKVFIANPFHAAAQGEPSIYARLYKTGDRARWLRNGQIEFMGRLDHQAKIRGFRIELGEIEARLLKRSDVRECVVVVHRISDADQRIVAYVVASDPATPQAAFRAGLKSGLSQFLPHYMMPAAFMVLKSLPLLPNGKVDRKALPEPVYGAGEQASAGTAMTPTQHRLGQLWASILGGNAQPSLRDTFFELGGHSLLLTKLINAVARTFNARLSFAETYEKPTLEQMAGAIDAALGRGDVHLADSLHSGAGVAADATAGEPLSHSQQQLWFIDQLQGSSEQYHLQLNFDVRGMLDLAGLEKALRRLQQRHETLQTHYQVRDGEPRQFVDAAAALELVAVDLSPAGDDERQRRFVEALDAAVSRPMALDTGPLLRAVAVTLAPEHHHLLLVVHHIAADGWSLELIKRDLSAFYARETGGGATPPAAVPVPFRDFARWERAQAETRLRREQAYWTQQLAGIPALHGLPLDRARPAEQRYRGAVWRHTIDEANLDGLRRLCLQEKATLFVGLHALLTAQIHRLSGDRDIVIGTPVAGRPDEELASTVGFFVNTLPLRCRADPADSFTGLLRRSRTVVVEAFDHQALSFAQLTEAVAPQRSLSHSPVFQIMLSLQNNERHPLTLTDARVCEVAPPVFTTCMFDLLLDVIEVDGGAHLTWEYSVDLFDEKTVAGIAAGFESLLGSVLADPGAAIGSLALPDAQEQDLLIRQCNATDSDFDATDLLHRGFERQALATPDAVAVRYRDRSMTYAGLNAQSDNLVRTIRAAGVQPGDLVGIHVHRSLDMLVGILAVLKAGAAYVPLDAKYPPARIRYMIQDSAMRCAITHRSLSQPLDASGVATIVIDDTHESYRDGWPAAPADGEAAVAGGEGAAADASALAYVIYTSGSTGAPKGVMIEHRNAVCFLDWVRRTYTAKELRSVLACTSICFDLSIFELFAPLSTGGQTVLVDSVLDLLEPQHGIDVSLINCVPSAMAELVAQAGIPPSVTTVNLAGEPLRRRLVDAIYRGSNVDTVYNLYGPSEDTTYSTYCKVERDSTAEPGIGRPVGNTRAYVLDGSLRPCPVGGIGELYLSGACLARGYLGKPQQTDAVFLANPLLGRAGHEDVAGRYGRLYRTGDLARLRPDATLEFLGRADHQVKLRGFRIELGEIESALLEHPDVRQSVVIVDEPGAEDRRLVGYVATGLGEPSFADLQRQLQERLREKLPHYMQLAALVVLEALPLTPNGKTDRSRLPRAVYASRSESGAPATAIEKTLAGIWCEVLRCDPGLRPGDNFFALGGHSLLLTRLINAVSQQLGVRLSMKDVYEAADLADMARRIGQSRDSGQPMPTADRAAELPLSYAQLRVWFVEQLDPGTNQNNIQVGVRLEGTVSLEHLQRSLDQIVDAHDAFRIRLVTTAAEPAQRVLAAPLSVPIKYHDLSQQQGGVEPAARDLLNRHGTQVFDLGRAPLFSVMLLKLSDQRFRLNVVVHHLIFDGVSFQSFLTELLGRYEALRGNRVYSREPSVFDYADYVLWQRRWLHSAQARQQEQFWHDYLAQPLERLRLPASVEEGEHPASGFLGIRLDPQLRDQLVAVAQRHQGTFFNVMHAAFCLLLGRLSGNLSVSTGIPVAGRNLAHSDAVYGNFLNNLPIRANIDLRETFDVYLRRQIAQTAQVLANQDLPFERIVELNPNRREDAAPLFNVFFNMQSEDAPAAKTSDFELLEDDVGIVDTKFDLTLYVLGGPQECSVQCHFRTAFATPATIERVLGQYARLLRAIAAHSDRACGALDLDADASAENPAAAAGDQDIRQFWPGPVHTLFEQVARRQPDKSAIVAGDDHYSYRQLLDAAIRFAAQLAEAGVGQGARVAVIASRTASLVVAVFATLRLGAAFSLLNPDQPADRILQLLEIVQPDGVVFCGEPARFDATLRARIAQRLTCAFMRSDLLASASAGAALPAAVDVAPQQPACITFTSGTSGVPKAVVGTHVGLSGYLDWWPARMGVGQADRFSLLSGLGHDPIQRDIFGSLCTGATLVIPDESELIPGRLAAWFARHRISVAHLTPAISQILCDTQERLPALKLVFLTGEKLHSERVYAIKRLNPDVVVLNSYGTTETQRGSTYCVASQFSTYRGTVPVGRSTPDTRLRILNESGHDCSLGEVGEIYLESYHLSNGYLNDPLSTARVLSIREDGFKRYRTGDYGCYLSDTLVRCLGRKDRQVNIRGYRADLSEVESACRRDAAVKDVAVVVLQSAGDTDAAQLVAYVVTDTPSAAFDARVMSRLRELLPSYLVPAAVVSLNALPLTRNGKLDESQLPLPELVTTELAAPQTEVERRLLRIWQNVLGREQIGATDNFFALGGHSLLALKMSGEVWRELGISLPLKALFERPTVRAVGEYIAKAGQATGLPVQLTARGGHSVAPLSFAQQRIYFLCQFPEQRALFNLPRAFALRGDLNRAALHGALQRLVQRHSSLRTLFVARGDEVVQQVAESGEFVLGTVDISALDAPSRAVRQQQLVDQEATTVFDLATDPKLRATLIVVGDADHILLLTLHHIASDGWSNSILLAELSRHYANLCQSAEMDGAVEPLRYIDYSIWQRDCQTAGKFEPSLAYWRNQLADLPALHSLPLDRERPLRQAFAGAHFESVIRADVADALRTLCGTTDSTLFMLLSAAWSVVLSRFGGATDIVIGTPVAGRDHPDQQGAVGCFINNLALRFDLRTEQSFLQYLGKVRETVLDAFAHADVPFEFLVDALNPARTQSHTPLFQIMLALQSYDEHALALAGVECQPAEQAYPCSKFDLSLYCRERAHGIEVLWEYATSIFDLATVRALSQAFAAVLESIAGNPALPLPQLALVDAAQQQRLLSLAAGPVRPPGDAAVHTLFERQCARAPDRLAIVASDGELTYAELNARADQIAHFLGTRAPSQAPVVGVCLDRSSWLVATLLGVMKAGGSYVPLDPVQPAPRLQAMVAQARVDVVLTETRYAERFAGAVEPAPVIAIDGDAAAAALSQAPADRPRGASAMDALAYIIFTSGSTGTPKGVAISHAALTNLLLSMAEAPGIESGDRLLAVTSIGFDIAGLELFLPLIRGAELHLADAATCKDANRLAAYLDRHAISMMQATPSMWQLLLDSGALRRGAATLKILVGGEMLGTSLCSRLCELGSAVWNLYGPTETTIWSMRWQCVSGQKVSIGRPIDNTQCYVLSAGLQLQPVGAVGELYIGGDGLAAGYYRQADLTAKSFIAHPFRPGGRLYKTGDLCRQAEDGSLFCLGRRDHQIKIRGFRVELGEVEAALLKCDGVGAGVVTLGTTAAGDACLFAHVTAAGSLPETDLAGERGRRVVAQLGALLPDYMVPSVVMFVAHLPLNANGKVDRAALPQIVMPRSGTQREAAQTPTERNLAGLWSDYLNVQDVGVTENFFSLGGNSILAMKLLARTNSEHGLSIPLQDFLETPTIRALAAQVERLAYLRQSSAAQREVADADAFGQEFIL